MKNLIALVVVIVGALGAYHALMFYDNNFRYGRMRETPAVKPHEEPLIRMEAGVVPVTGGDALLRATPGQVLTPPMISHPASAKAARYGSHGSIIKWQSKILSVRLRIALMTGGPNVMLGTK